MVGHRGQDGRLLTALLEARGVQVLGVGRDGLRPPEDLDRSVPGRFALEDPAAVAQLVAAMDPVHIYYLAAHHGPSEGNEASASAVGELEAALLVNARGPAYFLEALRGRPGSRFFLASSSLIFGDEGSGARQDEQTRLGPSGLYGLTKAIAGNACKDYRARFGVFCSVGILYNHESIYRGARFLSRKVCGAALRIRRGSAERLKLGNLDALVDWGYAPDYVEAFTRILALPEPGDFVVATGEAHTVREFLEVAFGHVGLRWQDHVDVERELLGRTGSGRIGDSGKLRRLTGWAPSVSFEQMVRRLVDELSAQEPP